jgi:sterol O-acyltransferase
MIMKMHSYITTNGQLKTASDHSKDLEKRLHNAAQAAGGWNKALAVANARRIETEEMSNSTDFSQRGTPDGYPEDKNVSIIDASTADTLRRRLTTLSSQLPSQSTTVNHASEGGFVIHPLIHHPTKSISDLAEELSEIQSELTSSGPHPVKWPDNITFRNFATYQLTPTLVYELEYPRTDRFVIVESRMKIVITDDGEYSIRPLYVFEKTVATFGTFALLYTVTESIILPLTPTPEQSFFRSLLDLALPFMISYLLLFYIIFGESG